MSLDPQETPLDRKTPIAILLCVLIFLGWQKFYLEPRTAAQQAANQANQSQLTPQATPQSVPPGTPSLTTPATGDSKLIAHESKPLQTGTGEAMIGNGPYLLTDWKLKNYHQGVSKDTPAVDLASVTHQSGEVLVSFDDPALAYLTGDGIRGELVQTAQGYSWLYNDANVRMTREYSTQPGGNTVDVRVSVEFKNKAPSLALVSVENEGHAKDAEAHDRQLFYFSNGSIERIQVAEEVKRAEAATPVKYVGTNTRYFLLAALNAGPDSPKAALGPAGPYNGRASLVYPVTGKSVVIPLRLYFGPKELQLLRSVDPTLDHTVDLGWFTVIAYPLLNILNLFYRWFKNYGVAIILLTILVKVVLYPLTYKSMKSMKEMAKVQPQLQKLREKYKDDKEALNREMLTLMKSHGYNPVAGCLPIFIQMPVFFALYRVLYSSIELYHAPFMFWIKDLAAQDPFYVTPVLLTVTMFVQQKVSPQTATDPAQQKMMQFMPIMFGAFMLYLPSGLTLYMLINALFSIGQQAYLNKKLK